MKIHAPLFLAALLWAPFAGAQSVPVDCNCVANLPQLKTNACQAAIPDLCLLATNCFSADVIVGSPGYCQQFPAPGTLVGPGTHWITLIVTDSQGVSLPCAVPFSVNPLPGCAFALLCAPDKSVECGTQWALDPPTWTNNCSPPPGTPSNGVVLTLLSLVTNGTCPEVITATWQGVDDCGSHDQCSQTVTVQDTTPPGLDCRCITNIVTPPLPMTVIACTGTIPDLCLPAMLCAWDNCGPLHCDQSPPAGTPVGVGIHPVTITISDCASNIAQCALDYTVVAPAGGCGTNPCVPPPTGLVGWWPLDELTGAPIYADLSGMGNAAFVESGGPVGNPGSPFAVAGKVAGAGYFYTPLTRGRALDAPSLNFGTGSFSMDCWVRPVQVGPLHRQPMVDKLDLTSLTTGSGYAVSIINARIQLRVGDGGPIATYTSVGSVAYNAWNFVGVSVDRGAGTVVFHLNGVSEPAQTLTPAGSFSSTVDLLIGGNYNAAELYGELAIDELELFNVPLSAADLTALWLADAAGKCKPTIPCTNSTVSIFCPPNLTVQTCGSHAVAQYPPPHASTSCGTITNLVCAPPSGAVFPLGTTTVTCVATDSQGNTASCQFTITVLGDTTPPLLDCNCLRDPAVNPALPPLTIQACDGAIPDLCPAALVCATDDCGSVTCSQHPAAGTPVGPGVHPITVTVSDGAGNTAACTVIFTVVVPESTRVWNTGMGGPNGNIVLPAGTPDPNYTLVAMPPGGCNGPAQVLNPLLIPAPPWITNGPDSQWIGADAGVNCQPGVYQYRLCFELTCTDGASVAGLWTADDFATVHLNGQPTGLTVPSAQFPNVGFNGWHPFLLTNGFVCGLNCLDFYVTNAHAFANPTGLRAQLTNTFNDCCCTATQTLFSVNSGMDAAGNALPQGALDPRFTLTCAPPGVSVTTPVVTQPHPSWIPNGPNSQWIGPFAPLLNAPAGVYCYTLQFDIPCPSNTPIRARLTGQWSADDTGTIHLNGQPTGLTLPNGWAFTNWHPINITSGFVPGLNTLTFYVTNGGGPTGLRLELTGAAACCPCDTTNCWTTIKCPPDTNVTTCAQGEVVFYPAPVASSSCGITNLTCVPPSGSFFPVGSTLVTCTATDANGSTASCTFTVTVSQVAQPWSVLCPPINLSVTGCPPVMPDLSALITIITNCPPPCPITITQSIPVGTPLTPGMHVVIIRTCDCTGVCFDCDVIVNAVETPGCCQLVPVLRLFTGATNHPPGVLPGGAFDTQFQTGPPGFTTANPYVPTSINGAWVPNTALSKWIGPFPNYANSPPGVFSYTNRFFLCSTNQARLTGRWTTDDTGRIWLNGAPTTNALTFGWAFTGWHNLSLNSGFVPGWNELVFRVTNGIFSVTGLRVEMTGTACCNSCVSIVCAPNILTNTCAGGAVVTFAPPIASSACGQIVSATCSPPSGSFFPVGTTVVNCTAIDSAGNAANCAFTVTVNQTNPPLPKVKCPGDRIIYTCGSNAVAYWKATATGHTGPVVCTPPSGTVFPLGTNLVTCTATNACGGKATCSFKVIVKPYPLGAPHLTLTAGLPDNFALPVEPSPQNACMVSAFSGYSFWKGFDATAVNTLLGHRFTGLPNNIIKAELVVRMKPGNSSGADNDGTFVGLPPACAPNTFLWSASIKTLPGAGGNWLPGHLPVTFTLDLGALNPALISHMNSLGRLDVVIHDDTTVDYMQLRLWRCPPPIIHHGLPYLTDLGTGFVSDLSVMPVPELPAFGPIGKVPAVCIAPPVGNPGVPNQVQISLGGGQAFSFTTVLDLNAPDGSEIVVSAPTPEGDYAPVLTLVKACGPPRCHWDLKKIKRLDGSATFTRVSAVNAGGEVLDSFIEAGDPADPESALALYPEDGVDQFPVSILLDARTGEITVTFPGQVARRLCNGLPCPRGWDGTVKGFTSDEARRKGWDGTVKCPCFDETASRVVFTPLGEPAPLALDSLRLSSTGLTDLVIAAPHRYGLEGEVMPASEDPVQIQVAEDGTGASFQAVEDYAGLTLNLGRTTAFDLGLLLEEAADLSGLEQYFRFGGPRWPPGTTTNRPPPPVFDVRLAQGPEGPELSADYSPLGATRVTVQLLNQGTLVAFGFVDGPVIFPEDALVFDRWPERMGLEGSNGVVSLRVSEPYNIQGFLGDELRIVPTLPAGTAYEFSGELQCRTTAGVETLLHGILRQSACALAPLSVTPGSAGTVITWSGDGYRLLGAETLDGPWLELGVRSPFVLAPNAPQRFFRLVCE